MSLDWSQPGGAGGPLVVSNANLIPGREYYNLLSIDPCPGAPGSGPILGLCASTPLAIEILAGQVSLPVGVPLFHFIATGSQAHWGPYLLPAPFPLDAITIDVTNGLINATSTVQRISVR